MEKLNAIEKAIAIMECVANEGNHKKIKDISALVGINRASVYRIVEQLQAHGLVFIDEETKKISIGIKAYQIGNSYINNIPSAEQIKYVLWEAAKAYPMSIGYCIKNEEIYKGRVQNIFEVSSINEGEVKHQIGRYYPVNRGSYGKTIMAFHEPQNEIKSILKSVPLYATTSKSITNIDDLLNEYSKIRKTGIGYSYEDTLEGYIGIGMPVRDMNGKVVGSVASACFIYDWNEEKQKIVETAIRKSVKEIEQILSNLNPC